MHLVFIIRPHTFCCWWALELHLKHSCHRNLWQGWKTRVRSTLIRHYNITSRVSLLARATKKLKGAKEDEDRLRRLRTRIGGIIWILEKNWLKLRWCQWEKVENKIPMGSIIMNSHHIQSFASKYRTLEMQSLWNTSRSTPLKKF